MTEMTTHERMTRMYEHRQADRVPITDSPWGSTVARWQREGLPTSVDVGEFLGLDQFVGIGADNSPRYPTQVLEETDEYVVTTTNWGATLKRWRHAGGVPEFLDFKVRDPDTWRDARARMQPTRDRIDWAYLAREYPKWRSRGAWITGEFWFGFDVAHSWMIGTERVLLAMVNDPEWIVDVFNHYLDVDIALFEQVWDAGYTFDAIRWPDDMGYKHAQFFSARMYRELLEPVHRRAADWAHARGIKVELHSCGDVRPFVDELIAIGIDMLNPIEVKAGMEPTTLKKTYGQRLAFHGGLNAVLFEQPELMWEEMKRVIPTMKEQGGYVISSDHSVPDSVSLAEFQHFVALAKALGAYA